jgi:hypothetical protein
VVQVIRTNAEGGEEIAYTLRIPGREYRVGVFEEGTYRIVVRGENWERTLEGLRAVESPPKREVGP